MTARDAPAALSPRPPAPPDWSALLAAAQPQALADAWLAALWPQLPQPLRAVVLLDDGRGQLRSAASLPRGGSLDGLAEPIGRAAASGRPLLERAGAAAAGGAAPPDRWIAVQPAVVSGRVRVAACVEFGPAAPPETAAACTAMQWGLGWLAAALAQRGPGSGDAGGDDDASMAAAAHLERSRHLFDLTLAVLSQPTHEDACLAAVNALAQRHDAALVQLAAWRRHRMRVEARSGAAWHDGRSQLVRQAEQAMSEAADDGASVRVAVSLPGEGDASAAPGAALAYAREASAGALAIVLLRADDQLAGALMLERRSPFTDDELASLEAQALLLGPVLHARRQAQQGLWAHARASASGSLRALTGSSRPALTASAALAALLVAGAALWPVTWRVTAPSTIEGEVQRAAVAPYQGFIRSAFARAGDTVKAGQTLARLDDRDLQLEKVRFQAELDVAQRKEREAMASGNRVDQRLAAAQAGQAGAQLDLALDKLRRIAVVAPFDGVIVRGDLSQQLGSPVEQGKVLFELAPLDSWRVILRVDERDAAHVRAGQRGEIVLASLPGVAQPFAVKRVTAVATAEDGRNFFRVEAELAQKTTLLRPGMEGVAKVEVDQRSLLWVATHRLVDWLRLTLWEWRP